jgi:hypothetical protein
MPEARAPVPNQRGTTTTITVKRPILLKEQALAIQHRLRGCPNIPVELLDNKELLAVRRYIINYTSDYLRINLAYFL